MVRVRGSVKRYAAKKRVWPHKMRSTTYRKTKVTQALKGPTAGVREAASVHRFVRKTDAITIVNVDGGGYVQFAARPDGVANIPVTLTAGPAPSASPGIVDAYAVGGAVQFTLNDVVDSADFKPLFDQYEIEQVDVEFDDMHNSAQHGDGAGRQTSIMPTICWVPDFDDATVPALAREITQYQRAQEWTFRGSGKPLKFSIKPRISTVVHRDAVLPAYAVGSQATMIDMSYPDVPHYGFKFWIDNLTSANPAVTGQTCIRMRLTYHLKFADPK